MLAAPTLDGFLLNSNDVRFECADDNSGVTLGYSAMTAVQVGDMTDA